MSNSLGAEPPRQEKEEEVQETRRGIDSGWKEKQAGHGTGREESDSREKRLMDTAQERRRGVGGKIVLSQYRKRGESDWREERLMVTAQEERVIPGKRGAWSQHRKGVGSDWGEERLVTAQEGRRE